MRHKKIRFMVTASLCITLGILLPIVTAHGFGISGNVFLPMHIPVLLCGLLCGPFYGAICGFMVPILSSILANMPPFFPNLPIMTAQLLIMGLTSGWIYQRNKWPVRISVGVAVAVGWVVYGAAFYCLRLIGVSQIGNLAVSAAVIRGLPGIVIQVLFLPLLMSRLGKVRLSEHNYEIVETPPLVQAKRLIQKREATCVVLQNEVIVRTDVGTGISPLLRLYDEEPEVLKNAVVVDKIIGKAAAMILVLAGVRMVYGEVMSAAGLAYLQQHQVQTAYGRCVEVIYNRASTGICPIESLVLSIDDAAAGVQSIRRRVRELRQVAG